MDLTEKQKADMRARFSTEAELFELLSKLIEGNYKLTLAWDNYSGGFAAYMFPVGDEHANAGHILTNRGASVFATVRGILYRHFVVFDQTWGNREAQGMDED